MFKKAVFIFFVMAISLHSCRKKKLKLWHGKECAVVLTYDDSLNEHLDNVIPALNEVDLKGTFYIIGSSDCFLNRKKEWRAAAKQGHELGNHTLMHPCANSPKRKVPLLPEKDLNNYTLKKVVDEIEETNVLLQEIDHKTERTFAFPCGQKKVNDTLFYEYVKNDFVAARGVKRTMKSVSKIDMSNIDAFGMKGHTGKEMIDLVDEAIQNKKLLVFLFHGVGGGSPLNVSAEAHKELLSYLQSKENQVWVAPMVTVGKHIKELKK